MAQKNKKTKQINGHFELTFTDSSSATPLQPISFSTGQISVNLDDQPGLARAIAEKPYLKKLIPLLREIADEYFISDNDGAQALIDQLNGK